jgi:hypothetical protein
MKSFKMYQINKLINLNEANNANGTIMIKHIKQIQNNLETIDHHSPWFKVYM